MTTTTSYCPSIAIAEAPQTDRHARGKGGGHLPTPLPVVAEGLRGRGETVARTSGGGQSGILGHARRGGK
eukprot:scaffold271198_cov32-Tisochrysis_lutea.AAC.2